MRGVEHLVHRPNYCVAGALLAEVVDVQEVGVDVGDAGPEEIPQGEVEVLADREDEVRTEVGAVDTAGELLGECVAALVPGAIEEVLLELIEEHKQLRIERLCG